MTELSIVLCWWSHYNFMFLWMFLHQRICYYYRFFYHNPIVSNLLLCNHNVINSPLFSRLPCFCGDWLCVSFWIFDSKPPLWIITSKKSIILCIIRYRNYWEACFAKKTEVAEKYAVSPHNSWKASMHGKLSLLYFVLLQDYFVQLVHKIHILLHNFVRHTKLPVIVMHKYLTSCILALMYWFGVNKILSA